MNKVKNATSNKVQNEKSLLVKKGDAIYVNENVKGKDLTNLQKAKKGLKEKAKEVRNSFEHNLGIIKDECRLETKQYLTELNSKFNLNLNGKEFFKILCDVKLYRNYLTEAQQLKVKENRMNYTTSTIVELIGRYFKANKIVLPKK